MSDYQGVSFFRSPNPVAVAPSPQLVAEKSDHEARLKRFNKLQHLAHQFERDVNLIRVLDRSENIDAALDHLEFAWSNLHEAYQAVRADVDRFVEKSYSDDEITKEEVTALGYAAGGAGPTARLPQKKAASWVQPADR